MDKETYLFLYEQRIKCLENQQRLWNAIDSKLALMLTQAFIFIGFSFSLLNGLEMLMATPIVISIILYLIGIWPQNQATLSSEMFSQISELLKNEPKSSIITILESLSCINDHEKLDELNSNMKNNDIRIHKKCIQFEIGMIVNIIGVILIVSYIIIK